MPVAYSLGFYDVDSFIVKLYVVGNCIDWNRVRVERSKL